MCPTKMRLALLLLCSLFGTGEKTSLLLSKNSLNSYGQKFVELIEVGTGAIESIPILGEISARHTFFLILEVINNLIYYYC